MDIYRNFGIEAPDYEPMAFYSSDEEDPAAFLAGIQGTYVPEAENG
jgi:DNA-directed RNA polymerase subunit beta'